MSAANAREANILALADNDPEITSVVHEAIVVHGLTVEAYATVFKHICANQPEPLCWMPTGKTWRRGGKAQTDMAVLQELATACKIIREYVLLSWENCVFSSWLPARELQRAERAMDAMESLDKLREILDLAAADMRPTNQGGKKDEGNIDWEPPSDTDENGGDEQ